MQPDYDSIQRDGKIIAETPPPLPCSSGRRPLPCCLVACAYSFLRPPVPDVLGISFSLCIDSPPSFSVGRTDLTETLRKIHAGRPLGADLSHGVLRNAAGGYECYDAPSKG
jgi:hypothetical protein